MNNRNILEERPAVIVALALSCACLHAEDDPFYAATGLRLTSAQSNLLSQAAIEAVADAATRLKGVTTNTLPASWTLLSVDGFEGEVWNLAPAEEKSKYYSATYAVTNENATLSVQFYKGRLRNATLTDAQTNGWQVGFYQGHLTEFWGVSASGWHGPWLGFHTNGNCGSFARFENQRLIGNAYEWDEEGNLTWTTNYAVPTVFPLFGTGD